MRVNEVEDNSVLLARARRDMGKMKKALRKFIALYGGSEAGPFGKRGEPPAGWVPPPRVTRDGVGPPVDGSELERIFGPGVKVKSRRTGGAALPPLFSAGSAIVGSTPKARRLGALHGSASSRSVGRRREYRDGMMTDATSLGRAGAALRGSAGEL